MNRLRFILLITAVALVGTGCLSFHPGPLPGEPADATFMEVDHTRVRYLDRGEGPPVVLIHGFNASLDTWTPVVDELAENHRVLALDLRGFGWSGRPEGQDYSPRGQAQLVFEFMDERGVDRADIVAHSWGASVALKMALMQPDRIDRLALYSAWVFDEQLPSFFYWSRARGVGEALFALFYRERPEDKMSQAFYDPYAMDQELVEHTTEMLHRPGTLAAALEATRGQRYDEVEERYTEIEHPTLLLWGREDRVTRLGAGERLAATLPNADLHVFGRCGHFPMIEAQGASTNRLVEFLAPTDDGGAL